MTKISELDSIQGSITKSRDLFVTVNLDQGSEGTKNISREQLVRAIEQETFQDLKATGGEISDLEIVNPSIEVEEAFVSPIEASDYFYLRDATNGKTVALSYSQLFDEISTTSRKSNKVYVSGEGDDSYSGSYLQPYATLEKAFEEIQIAANSGISSSISVLPGDYYTDGNLALPDNCSIVATNGQYSTNIIMNIGSEENNCFLVGSGCYVQGFTFRNQRVDDLDNPSSGFAIAFRPGALIRRSPYIRDVGQVSNYTQQSIAAPLDPVNANPLVGRGGGVILADRSILNQNSIFPYMLAFGATPRSPNGLGYVAKNGAGINGISSISIFQRTAFYALNGGQITLNNSGTQFGDISMRAKGSTLVVDPAETAASNLVTAVTLGNEILDNTQAIIDDMWDYLVAQGYTIDEILTRRDASFFVTSLGYDLISGSQTGSRNFVAGFFDYKADLLFDPSEAAGSGTLQDAFFDSFDRIKAYINTTFSPSSAEQTMMTALIDDVIKQTITSPTKLLFGSLIESLGHQFNLAGAGVNKNALPLNFRRVGEPLSAAGSVLQEDGGRVRWSGADELNNQYFAGGLRVNGRTGRLEGRPFTSSVRKLARRAANSRVSI
jgi:hypothetical protein